MSRPRSHIRAQRSSAQSNARGLPLLRELKIGQQAILAAGALAAALLSIVALVKAFHHANPLPPTASQATITQAAISESNITRRSYCAEQAKQFQATCLANGSPSDLGDNWNVQINLAGYTANKACCQLHYTIYQVDSRGQALNAVTGYRDVVAIDKITPRNARGDKRIFSLWIPYPKPGLFQIAFQAFDQDGLTSTMKTKTYQLN